MAQPPRFHRARQPGAALAQKEPPRIIEFESIPDVVKPRKPSPYRMDLSEVLSADEVQEITDAGRMTLHCIGDTGGVKRPEAQLLVARGMEESLNKGTLTPPTLRGAAMSPSFCYHLGDVVYYNGEVTDYWDQFYEPYEHYPLPILGIPGNHDGELLTRQSTSLLGFYENFCAPNPNTFTHESRDSGRPAMHQPFVYWTLTTPLATIIGLYTNVPDHGRISDEQRAWFHSEMEAAAKDQDKKNKALIVALHHPVYSFDGHHSGSPTMAKELEDAINKSRRVPNMVLSGHVHNYQRIELNTLGLTIPFFVIGNSGYWNLHHLVSSIGFRDPDTTAVLKSGIDSRHGFATFEVSPKVINGHFTTVPRPQESWTDPNAYNANFDVFSYTAEPLMLPEGKNVVLAPEDGAHVAPQPHHGPNKPAHGGPHQPAHRSAAGQKAAKARQAHEERTHKRAVSHRHA
jgi:hypothetical protein